MESYSERVAVAHHEAGHAVAAVMAGFPIVSVELHTEPELHGRLTMDEPRLRALEKATNYVERQAFVGLAGLAAEVHYFNSVGASSELEQKGHNGDFRTVGTMLRDNGLAHDFNTLLARSGLAMGLLQQDRQWAAIVRIAEALLDRRHLDGNDVRSLAGELPEYGNDDIALAQIALIPANIVAIPSGTFLPPPAARKISRKLAGLEHDLSQFYSMKAVLEELFGKQMYDRLKENGSFKEWQEATVRALRALDISISASVKVADDCWRDEVSSVIEHGVAGIREARSMADLFANLSAALLRLSFTQVGLMPSRPGTHTPRLRPDEWRLDSYRSVQYVQTEEQRSNALHARKMATAAQHDGKIAAGYLPADDIEEDTPTEGEA